MNCVNTLYNNEKKIWANSVIVFWFNLEVYWVCIEFFLGGASTNTAFFKYLIYFILSIGILSLDRFKLNKKFLCFLCVYLAVVFINIMVVQWKRYAIVEAIPPMIIALPAFLVISSSEFDLEKCLNKWYFFCVFNSCLLAVLLIINVFKSEVNYGAISVITYSNTMILWFVFIKGIRKGIVCFTLLLFNNIAGIIFGSRMPALAAIITMIVSVFFISSIKKKVKYIFVMILTGGVGCLILLYREILELVRKILEKTGVYSRSIERVYLEIESDTSIFEMMLDSGRGDIWKSVLECLKKNFITPHGFGFVRYITGGRYYFSHNIIFDILIIFGIFSLFFVLFTGVKLYDYKKKNPKLYSEFVLIFLIFFLIRSLTGAYFLSDKYSLMVIALIFFSKRKCL